MEISREQPPAPSAVGGLDAHRAVDRKAAAMRPLPHRLRGILRQQATAHEQPQHAPAHLRLHLMVWTPPFLNRHRGAKVEV